ncbi:hypothetical protein Tco_1056375 [Tanacetum coccineum]|uniref:Uncharacterized protein n=1 Tax=Tanacetum coccineum TaxID=301880 RepID=A0ABQ5H2B4_9ASTR
MEMTKAVIYTPQCDDMIVESVLFQRNNFARNFTEAFTQTPSVLYQNYLEEFWYTALVVDLNPLTNDSEAHPLKELSIKFTVNNGKMPLTLNYKTFFQTTGLKYNNGNYVTNPSIKEVKAKLAKIANHEELVQEPLKHPFLWLRGSWVGTKYQVDQTQSTRFKVSGPYHNKGNTSSKVEPNTESLILATFCEIQALLKDFEEELKDERSMDIKVFNNDVPTTNKINEASVEERKTLLKALNRVSETLEVDSALKETMQKKAETNTTTSGNITNLTELLRNANLPEIITQLNAFQTSLASLSS